MAVQITDPAQLEGSKVTGSDGTKLGKVDAVYFDNETERPEWAAVKSGMFGSDVSLVPLTTAEYDGAALQVPYDKARLKDAPHHDPGKELTPAEEADLFYYYGFTYRPVVEPHGGDGSGERSADESMTRSEERMRVGTEQTTTGKARLRKYVVTEHQQVNVPVSHEEVRVEREPITDADRGAERPEISEGEREVTLHAERPVVDKEAEPVERVRLGTETVSEQQEVGGDVRREEIEVDEGPDPQR